MPVDAHTARVDSATEEAGHGGVVSSSTAVAPASRIALVPMKSRERSPIEITGQDSPLVAPGSYEAVGGKATLYTFRGASKLSVKWTISIPDEGLPSGVRNVTLLRHYNVRRGRDGRLVARSGTHYGREWTIAADRRLDRRPSPRVFDGVLCRVEVTTVTHDADQQPLPPHARYSRVSRVLERLAGSGR
jgi:hypothetical protein